MDKKTVESKPKMESFYQADTETTRLFNYYNSEFASLSSEQIKFYFEAARKGINFFKAFLFEEIKRRDLRISGLVQTRKLSLLGQDWKIECEDERLKEFAELNISRFPFDQFLTDIIEAQLQGMSHFVLRLTPENNNLILKGADMIPNYLTFERNGTYFIDLNKISYFDLRSEASGEEPKLPLIEIDPLYLFSVYSFDGNEDNGLLNGVIDSVIWAYFFKSYSIKDWGVFLERFAMPAVVGEYDQLMNPADKTAFKNAVMNFGNLFRGVIPSGAKINLLTDNSKSAAAGLYSEYVKYWNDEIAIRILGQAMTTDTGEGGSYAKAKVGDHVRADILKGDMSLVTHSVNNLLKKLIDINYAGIKEYPKFSFTAETDLAEKIKRAEILVKLKQAGMELDPEEIGNEFGYKLSKSSNIPTEYGEKIRKGEVEKFLEGFINPMVCSDDSL